MVINGKKKCSKCQEWYDISYFYESGKNRGDGLRYDCKRCHTTTCQDLQIKKREAQNFEGVVNLQQINHRSSVTNDLKSSSEKKKASNRSMADGQNDNQDALIKKLFQLRDVGALTEEEYMRLKDGIKEPQETESYVYKQYLTYAQASEFTSLSRWTLLRAAQNGEITMYDVGRKLFKRQELKSWIEKHRIDTMTSREES